MHIVRFAGIHVIILISFDLIMFRKVLQKSVISNLLILSYGRYHKYCHTFFHPCLYFKCSVELTSKLPDIFSPYLPPVRLIIVPKITSYVTFYATLNCQLMTIHNSHWMLQELVKMQIIVKRKLLIHKISTNIFQGHHECFCL